MITNRTKIQLVIFAVITMLGVAFVGARYAQLDRLFYDATYEVTAKYVNSGGIFTTAEVTYRGVKIGTVSDMRLTSEGVDVILSIDKNVNQIPADTVALVGNKSAVGEQYVELAPRSDDGPYLTHGSVIELADTEIPVSTTELLANADALVRSIPTDSLRTVVSEMGAALKDTGDDLGQIIDTGVDFIDTANANFEVTQALLRDANTVLKTQSDKATAIQSFAKDMALFAHTMASSDKNLRKLLRVGGASAGEVRTFLEDNEVNLELLLNDLVTTGEIVVRHVPGIRQILVLYPYMIAGGYTVAAKNHAGYSARFGLVLTMDPAICSEGYNVSERRDPLDLSDRPMDVNARCTSPPSKTNARGAQNAPIPPLAQRVAPTSEDTPVATYDLDTGTLTWADQPADNIVNTGGSADLFGKDPWAHLLLGPLTQD